jgi:hypothetical protein
MPRGVPIRLALLMAYLAIPIDVIPDFIPVLGYADDAVIITLVLRSTVRRRPRRRPRPLARHRRRLRRPVPPDRTHAAVNPHKPEDADSALARRQQLTTRSWYGAVIKEAELL